MKKQHSLASLRKAVARMELVQPVPAILLGDARKAFEASRYELEMARAEYQASRKALERFEWWRSK